MGQGVVQIEPNWVWSMTLVPRVYYKKNFWYCLPRKKVRFSYGNLRILRITNFKNRFISCGQKVVQNERHSAWSIPCVGIVFKLSVTIRLFEFTVSVLLSKIAGIFVFISCFQIFVYGSDLARKDQIIGHDKRKKRFQGKV